MRKDFCFVFFRNRQLQHLGTGQTFEGEAASHMLETTSSNKAIHVKQFKRQLELKAQFVKHVMILNLFCNSKIYNMYKTNFLTWSFLFTSVSTACFCVARTGLHILR